MVAVSESMAKVVLWIPPRFLKKTILSPRFLYFFLRQMQRRKSSLKIMDVSGPSTKDSFCHRQSRKQLDSSTWTQNTHRWS